MRPFFQALPLLVILICQVSANTDTAPFPPTPLPPERYAPIWEQSPFSLASDADNQNQSTFALNLVLVGAGAIGEDSFITILDQSTQERKTLFQGTPDSQGITLVEFHPSQDPLETTAILEKDGARAEIRFSPALLAFAPPPNTTGQPQQDTSKGKQPATNSVISPKNIPERILRRIQEIRSQKR